ncbi:hypothetical protein JCM5296_002586 [Sporobolomyces johnsonii]
MFHRIPQVAADASFVDHSPHRLPSSSSLSRSTPLRHKTSNSEAAYHPYKSLNPPPPPPSTSKPILFVDTTSQAASSGEPVPHCRPKRKRITPEQLVKLTAVFEMTESPSYDIRDQLGAELDMTNREVQVWFQNRRAKVNRQKAAALVKEEATQRGAAGQGGPPSSVAVPPVARPGPPAETMSSGQHQWRFHVPPSTHVSLPAQAFSPRPPPPPSFTTTRPPPPRRTAPLPPPSPRHSHYRRAFGGQQIHLPPPSARLLYLPPPPELSPALSAGHSSSSYFPRAITPPSPYTSTSPGDVSPASASGSCYFSRDGAVSPFTPNLVSSPSGAFLGLTLDSPHVGALSPRSFSGPQRLPSPAQSDPPKRIRLAPISSFGPWRPPPSSEGPASRPMHRRSISDSAAHGAFLPSAAASPFAKRSSSSAVRLPSLRGLLNDPVPSFPLFAPASTPASSTTTARTLSRPSLSPPARRLVLPLPPTTASFHSAPLSNRPVFPSSSYPSSSPPHVSRSRLISSGYSTVNVPGEPSLERIGVGAREASTRESLGLGLLAAASELRTDDVQEERFAASQKLLSG